MKLIKVIISIILTFFLTACSENRDDFIDEFPTSPESKASEKFYNSKTFKEYNEAGINLSCGQICVDVTDEYLSLLDSSKERFIQTKRKMKYIYLTKEDKISLSHPAGTYIISIPLSINEEEIIKAQDIFELTMSVEDKIESEIFVSTIDNETESALRIVDNNSDKFKLLGLETYYLTRYIGTGYDHFRRTADVNVLTLNKSINTILYRLDLSIKIREALPNLRVRMESPANKNYSFLEEIVSNLGRIKSIINNNSFVSLIDFENDYNSPEDTYVSASSRLTRYVHFITNINIEQFLEILSYENYLFELERTLKRPVMHKDAYASNVRYQKCLKNLPLISEIINSKKDKIEKIYIAYDFYDEKYESNFKDRILNLNCSRDSISKMTEIINSI